MATSNTTIQKLVNDVLHAEVILPDFQRSFVWKPDDVRDLLVSVLGDYYIGSMLFMEAISTEQPFALRLVEGVKEIRSDAEISSIVRILLDGQQRTSSLFYALCRPPIPLTGRKNPFLFYMHTPSVLSENWEKGIRFVNVGNKREQAEVERNEEYIAFNLFMKIDELSSRIINGPFKDKVGQILAIVNRFNAYEIQMINLPRSTSLERVVETFERINRTGEPLSVTDLLVARLYVEKIKLRAMMQEVEENYSFYGVVGADYILRTICLIRGLEVRRSEILQFSATNFVEDWDLATRSLDAAYRRILDTKAGYGVLDFAKWMPYSPMLVPMAALIAYLEKEKQINGLNLSKIDQWYWASALGGRYNEAVNTNSFYDLPKMKEWFRNTESVPDFIRNFDASAVDLAVDYRQSAIYRAVFGIYVRMGVLDFKTGQPPEVDVSKIQDDHIFPRSIYKVDTVLNRTIISTNQEKGFKTPKEYFGALEVILGRKKLEEILMTHLIDPTALSSLLDNDLPNFIAAREATVRAKIRELVPSSSSATKLSAAVGGEP